MRAVAIILLILGVLIFCDACAYTPEPQVVVKFHQVTNSQVLMTEVVDLNNDTDDELFLLERDDSALDRPGPGIYKLNSYPFNLRGAIDQINLTQFGPFLAYHDALTRETRIAHFVINKDLELVMKRYAIDGKLLGEKPLMLLPDRNKSGVWEGHIFPVCTMDLNQDGVEDLVMNLRAAQDLQPRGYLCIDGKTFDQLPGFSCPSIANSDCSLVADTDGDGKPEFIIGTSASANGAVWSDLDDYSSYIFIVRTDGTIVSHWKIGNKFSDVRILDVSDVDQDGEIEITYLKNGHFDLDPEDEGVFSIRARDGIIKKKFATSLRYQNYTATADIDSDGKLEFILLDRSGGIIILNNVLNIVCTLNAPELQDSFLVTTFDENEDGQREIYVVGTERHLRVYSNELLPLASAILPGTKDSIFETEANVMKSGRGQPKKLILSFGNTWQITLEQNIAAVAYNVQTPIIIGAVLVIASLLIILLRRTTELEIEKNKVRHLLASDSERGVVMIDNKFHIEQANDAVVRYVEPGTLTVLEKVSGDGESLARRIRGLVERLRESPSQEMGVHGVTIHSSANTGGNKAVDIMARKITDYRGDVHGVLVNIRDTWQQKWARTAAENVHIGQELMHKIKTLISVYRNDIYMLRKLVEENAERHRYLEIITEMFSVSEDITEITKAFLTLSKIDQSRREATDFNRLLIDAVQPIAGSVQKKISFDFQLAENLAPILIDQEQIQSLILNLVENAVNAINQEGRIILRTEYFRRMSETANWSMLDYLAFSIEDSGIGFEETMVERIFEPGYSGFPGRVGLGLTISKRIVDNHEGEILISSIANKGTIVTVRLPYKG